MKKVRVLAIILALVTGFTLLPAYAFAEGTEEETAFAETLIGAETRDAAEPVIGADSEEYEVIEEPAWFEGTAISEETEAVPEIAGAEVPVPAPAAVEPENTPDGIRLTWASVEGAAEYQVMVRKDGGSWGEAGTTSDTAFEYTDSEAGTRYFFRVRTRVSGNWSEYSEEVSILHRVCPEISVSNTSAGVSVSWTATEDTDHYEVYYRETGAENWETAAETAGTKQTVPASRLTCGTEYEFSVRSFASDGTASGYAVQVLRYLSTPSVSITNTASGVRVDWGAIAGSTSYHVYRRVVGGSWGAPVANVTGTSYTLSASDLTSGKEYEITVRAFDAGGTMSAYKAQRIRFMATPSVSVTNTTSGVRVSWGSVGGAVNYHVYYRTVGGRWSSPLASVTGTSYTVPASKLTSGTMYEFTVRSFASDGTMSDFTGQRIRYLTTPSVSVSNTSSGVRVSWGAIEGATCYHVYRRAVGGSWGAPVANVTGTSYTVPASGLTSGREYEFTVRAFDDAGMMSAYTARRIRFMATPSVSVTNTTSGVRVSWGSVAGAASYHVYYRTAGGSWSAPLASVTGTSYTVPSSKLTSGKEYEFTVRAFASDQTMSAYTAHRIRFLTTPSVSVTNTTSGVRVSWGSVGGAASYHVYCRAVGGRWGSPIANVTGTSYSISASKLTSGKEYEFTVRAFDSNGTMSAYTAVRMRFVTTPQVTVSNSAGGVRVSWEAVPGASEYHVYYRTAGGSWSSPLASVTGTTYTVPASKMTSGRDYEFTVRAFDSNGTMSAYIASKIRFMAAPDVTVVNTPSGVRVSWGAVSGAASYHVYYRTVGGSWSAPLANVTGTTYTVSSSRLTVGTQYEFTVRAFASDGTMSAYKGEKIRFTQHVVCIDAGHQTNSHTARIPEGPGADMSDYEQTNIGVTVGAHGLTTGKMEYQLNLEISLQLRDRLEAAGIGVVMIRTTNNVDITNDERARIANESGADISIHIHADSVDDTSVRGAHCIIISKDNKYTPGIYSESKRLASCLLQNYLAATEFPMRYYKMGGVNELDYYPMLNWSTIPTCIIEMGFMTNQTEDTKMSDAAFQKIMVGGLFNGIMEYYGLN